MAASEFDDFDPTNYQTLPRLSPHASLTLARELLARVPTPASERVREATGRLQAEFESLEAAIAKRRGLASELTLEQEAELDEFVDALWVDLHTRLESWSTFERPGASVLASMSNSAIDYDRQADLARQAREITELLFGRGGTSFVARGYRQQAEAMGRILAAIDRFQLANTITTLVGPDLLAILRDAQVHYTAMVRARGEREKNLGISLRELAGQMRWRINLYVVHVLSLLDRNKPDTLEIVRVSLRPILDFRQSMRVRGDGSDSGEWTYDGLRGRL
jgi:hypothetical protein